MICAGIGVSGTNFSFDTLFYYAVPEDGAQVGQRVIIPFGGGSRHRLGIILDIDEAHDDSGNIKSIISVIDEKPFLSEEQAAIVRYLADVTMCTYYEAFRAIVPPGFGLEMSKEFVLTKKSLDDTLSDRALRLARCAKNAETAEDVQAILTSDQKALSELLNGGFAEERSSTRQKIADKTLTMVRLRSGWEDKSLTPKQKAAAHILEREGSASVKELCYLAGCSQSVVDKLIVCGAAETYTVIEELPKGSEAVDDLSSIELTPQQNSVYSSIADMIGAGKPRSVLIHGVTGSGKTLVFVKLIEYTLSLRRTVIVMIPEISLTPQTVSRFSGLFGETVAIMHSGLSLSQRNTEYRRIKEGKCRIVVGTRSAVFSPLENIGLIVMDEEGERTYKSERSPRYSAKEAAAFRCARHGAVLLMASATPSVESYYGAVQGSTALFEMNMRYNGNPARVRLVNTAGFDRNFSYELVEAVRERISRGEQSIILLNRRGYSTYAKCSECKTPLTCPNCSVGLTYHKKNRMLMCHYCGHSQPMNAVCPKCGMAAVKLTGSGTQRLEEEIAEYFPDARVLRMDADTTYSRMSYSENFDDFRNGKYDIMVGTQMIAKGLDFENVTLVGVTGIDRALGTGDFRAYERIFSLVTQVVGRSGRGSKPGEALIQTDQPDHYIISLASRQDYKGFFEQEIKLRKALIYPPFCDICVVGISSLSDAQAEQAAKIFESSLREECSVLKARGVKLPLVIYRATKCDIERIAGFFRYKIVIKCKNDRTFRDYINPIRRKALTLKEFKGVSLYVDINGDIP